MTDRIITILDAADTSRTFIARILNTDTLSQIGVDLPLTHRGSGRYSTNQITGLAGTAASPIQYISALYEGPSFHSSTEFWWDGAEIVGTPAAVAIDYDRINLSVPAVTGGIGEQPNAVEYTGGQVYQTPVYSGRSGFEVGGDLDKVKRSLFAV